MSEYRSHHHVTSICRYHMVCCPKYRRKVLTPPRDERRKTILMEPIERWEQELIAMDVMPDHGHRLVGCDPPFGMHRLIKRLKDYASHQLRREYSALKRRWPSRWTNSSFVATVGGVTWETVKRSVESQKDR